MKKRCKKDLAISSRNKLSFNPILNQANKEQKDLNLLASDMNHNISIKKGIDNNTFSPIKIYMNLHKTCVAT